MDHPPGEPIEGIRDRVLEAALDELRIRGIDAFTIDNVAHRAGVDAAVINAHWHDWRVLLMDAQLTRARQQIPTPNNGDLREDLVAYAKSLMEVANTVQGRRWFHRNLPNGQDTDFSEVRSDFWSIRFSELLPIMLEAAARGEIRADIDALTALQAFSAALYYPVIFADSPVQADFADQVVAIFLHGVTTRADG